MKQNWRNLGIEELRARYGYEENVAEHVWESAYRKALRRARSRGVTQDINISREVYSSIFYRGSQLFDVKVDDLSPAVSVAKEFESIDDLEKAFTERRFKNMAGKYKEINQYLKQYKQGRISYKTFRQKVKAFRDTNAEYQMAGS